MVITREFQVARFFKQTQKRAIIKRDGLYLVKTPDMQTIHRTFEEAVDSYHMLYGPHAAIAGPIDDTFQPTPIAIEPVVQPKPMTPAQIEREKTFDQMAEMYAKQVDSFEAVMRKSHGIRAKVAAEKAQRMKDRVKYCEAMAKNLGGSSDQEAA
jgi:hypothetical protein